MRYIVRRSYVDVLGYIWMPHALCSLHVPCDGHAIENMRDNAGHITRDSIADWLTRNTGDFQSVEDFSASIEDGDETLDFPWSSEENECRYLDTLGDRE